MPTTVKAQNLYPKMVPFQIFQDASSSKSSTPTSQNLAFPNLPRRLEQLKLKTYIPKSCLFKSSEMPQAATAQNLHPKCCLFKSSKMPQAATAQNLHPKLCLSKSSKMPRTAKAQNLHPKMLPLQIFPDASNSKSSKPTSQNVAFPNLPRCQQQQKLRNLHPKLLPFQISRDASNSKSL